MKEAYYFPHDANARTDAKILELRAEMGWEGYGLWWALVEQLREAGDYKLSNSLIGGLAMGLAVPKEQLRALLDLCIAVGLLVVDGQHFYSPSLRRRMVALDNKRLARVESARNAAEKRWQSAGNADAMRPHAERMPSAMPIDATIEESKEDLTKPEESKAEEPSSLCSEAAPEVEKKIEPVVLVLENPDASASHTRGAADVPTRLKRRAVLAGPLAHLVNAGGIAEAVQGMKKPLTQAEADGLVADYGEDAAARILQEMANYAKLGNNVSANLTARKWLDKRMLESLKQFTNDNPPHYRPQNGATGHGFRAAPAVHANAFGIASPQSLAIAGALAVGSNGHYPDLI